MQCRTNWAGAGQLLYLRVINEQLGAELWANAKTAYQNWNVPQGAQSFRDYARPNDSYIYMKIDNIISAPNGYTLNCISSCGVASGNILWSEVYVPAANANYSTSLQVAIFAHELGHTLGLHHHDSSVALMWGGGTTLQGPNVSVDIDDNAGCSGSTSALGVSCIYATN